MKETIKIDMAESSQYWETSLQEHIRGVNVDLLYALPQVGISYNPDWRNFELIKLLDNGICPCNTGEFYNPITQLCVKPNITIHEKTDYFGDTIKHYCY